MTRSRTGLIVISVVLGLLIIIKFFIPIAMRIYINDSIKKDPDYSGSVHSVSLHILRPGVSLIGLHLEGRATTDKPILNIRQINLNLNITDLFKGHLLMRVSLNTPTLYFIVLKPSKTQAPPPTYIWQAARAQILPIPVNDVFIHKGGLHYIDRTADPAFDLKVTKIEAKLKDLQAIPSEQKPLPTTLEVSAETIGNAEAKTAIQFNPHAKTPTFALKFSLAHLQLNQINSFLEAYTDLHAAQGEFSLLLSAEAANGKLSGYAKPFFTNVKLVVPPKHQGNPIKHLYKAVAQWLAETLKNNDTQHVATKVNFGGPINDPDASLWSTVANLLRNAFLEALLPQFE